MKVGRNEPCPCGSGKKYKYCCYAKDSVKSATTVTEEPESNTAAEEETAAEGQKKKPVSFQRSQRRTKFHGDGRGKGSSFQPRTQRGSQRGT